MIPTGVSQSTDVSKPRLDDLDATSASVADRESVIVDDDR